MGDYGPRVISLCLGAGGLDLGFQEAGFELIWANDKDPWACKTYEANIGEHIVCGDALKPRFLMMWKPMSLLEARRARASQLSAR